MFAEKEIVGTSTVKISSNKITLPKFCYVDGQEELLLMSDGTDYFLYSKCRFEAIIEKYQQLLAQTNKIEEKRAIRRKIKIFYLLVLESVVCDKYRRVNISRICEKDKTSATLSGDKRRLIIKIG